MNCPTCNQKGKHIDTQTVKGVLKVSLEILDKGNPYYYCKTQDCPVVYFHENGEQTIGVEDLRVSVYHKAPDDDETSICYCFGLTVGSVRADFVETEGKESIGRIRAGISAEQCACDIRNPEGDCCLGNVAARVKEMQVELVG